MKVNYTYSECKSYSRNCRCICRCYWWRPKLSEQPTDLHT